VEGYFTIPDNKKLDNLRLPAVDYEDGTASQPTGSVLFSFPAQLSACTAPSNIVIAEKVVKPSDSETGSGVLNLTWTAGKAGTNNAIVGYEIFWRNASVGGANPTTSTYAGKITVGNVTSYKLNLSDADENYSSTKYRARKLIVGIRTLGKAGDGYHSPLAISSSSCYINDLPAKPSISMTAKRSDGSTLNPTNNKSTSTNLYLPSTGGKVTFTCTAGSDTRSKATPSVYYSTSSIGTKTKISTQTLDIAWGSGETSKKYYFWTYDGLEYSSDYTVMTVTKNTVPSITKFSVGGTEVVHKRSLSREKIDGVNTPPYVINPTLSYTGATTNVTTKYELFTRAGKNYSDVKVWEGTSAPTGDIRSKFQNKITTGTYYRFSLTLSDGYDESATVDSNYLYVAPPPEIVNYRDFKITKEPGADDGFKVEGGKFFYEDMTFFVPYDAAYPIGQVKVASDLNGTKTYNVNNTQIKPSGEGNNSIIYCTCSDLSPSASCTFSLISHPNDDIGDITITADGGLNLQKIPSIDTSNIKITGFNVGELHVYTREWLIININKFFEKSLKDCADYYKLRGWYVYYNNTWVYDTQTFPEENPTNDIYQLSFKTSWLRDALDKLNIDKSKGFDIKPTLRLYTVYNNYYEITCEDETSLTIIYNEPLEIDSLKFDKPNVSYFKEGDTLEFFGTIKSYNGAPYARIVRVDTNNKNNINVYQNFGKLTKGKNSPDLDTNSPEVYPFEYTRTLGEVTTPSGKFTYEIQTAKDSAFTIDLKSQAFYDNNNKTEFDMYGHTAPVVSIESAIYSDDSATIKCASFDPKIAEARYKETDISYSFDYFLDGDSKLIAGDDGTVVSGEESIKNFKKNPTFSFSFQPKATSWSIAKVDLTITVWHRPEESPDSRSTGKTYTTTLYLYNISPTVSYRQNYLSINRPPEEITNTDVQISEGVIFINGYQNYQKIYLISAENTRVIDLSSGKITGFVIDGGEWT
jgi:hypothetical protein